MLGGAILTITRRNAVHSAISLIVSLLGVAGLYLLQQAEFLFAVQIVLYIGGIMVLFLFVIMLVNLDEAAKERQFNGQWLVALACVAGGGRGARFFLYRRQRMRSSFAERPRRLPAGDRQRRDGRRRRSSREYLLPFEIASVLLLVAVVGSVVMAKKRI